MTDELIEQITADLFTSGDAVKADRLVLVDRHGNKLGGWEQQAMALRIRLLFRQANQREADARRRNGEST